MVTSVERSRQPGRNDPCPCGSGKKYKRCCLLHEVAIPTRHIDDVMAEVYAADEIGDGDGAITVLEDAIPTLHLPELENLLVERYLELPAERAETQLRRWWEQGHDRFSGGGLAEILARQNRREEALAILNESQGNDAWPEYWHLLATLRDEQGETSAAVAAMELYTRLAPEDAEAWTMLADMQQRAGLAERALVSLRRAGELVPERLAPRLLRTTLLAEEGRWREVRDLTEGLLEGEFDDATTEMLYTVQDLLAQAYFVLGEFDAARQRWTSLLEQQPENVEVCYHLAHLESTVGRHRRALMVADRYPGDPLDTRVLDIRLRALLALGEYDEAAVIATQLETSNPTVQIVPLVLAGHAASRKEYVWALEQLEGKPAERYHDLWYNLRLECMAHANIWDDFLPTLKAIEQPDDGLLIRTTLAALSSGKFDLAERLLERMDDQQSMEARSLHALLGPLRQYRRASEVRRQQQVDLAEKQRRAVELRELRREVHDLEGRNILLAQALADAESAIKRLTGIIGLTVEGAGLDLESQLRDIANRAHRDVVAQERQQAEARLRAMLGSGGWGGLTESVRTSLREGERLYSSSDDERDYGSALMGYARGLESAYKDAVFAPARVRWQREPGALARLQDEVHDPSLGPFVRYLLQGGHLTLGSMAAALDRMGDVRRDGVAISLLRRIVRVSPYDERTLLDWKRTAERLAMAADARNRPAHAAAVSREEVGEFRELVLGSDGLLCALSGL